MKTNTGGQLDCGRGGDGRALDGRVVIARAFTLVEILISVAAMALIAVGLATIFGAIGRTVTAGRSVSAFTSYAAAIERQMRADFAGMSREFPLVIRNEWAGDVAPPAPNLPKAGIPMFPGDTNLRARRIDEIVFGIKGPAASARAPLYPGITARGDSSRIYYGHGQSRVVTLSPNDCPYLYPKLDDSNADQAAGLGANNFNNPNHYAKDWTLLRHRTVFAGPTVTDDSPPALSDGVVYLDNDLQVGLQPAASSPFRALAAKLPKDEWPVFPYDNLIRGDVRPQPPSGIVDVVTSDFAEVRAIVTTSSLLPVHVNSEQDLRDALANGWFDPNDVNNPAAPDKGPIDRMHEWMDELMPSWSMAPAVKDRVRIRYEPAAPNYFAALAQQPPYDDPSGIKGDWGRADQVMLSSSNFLPHCSEFIVEWSFGKVWTPLNPKTPGWDKDKSGTPIWHGLKREVSLDPKNPAVLTTVAQPYDETLLINGQKRLEFKEVYRPLNPTLDANGKAILGEYLVTKRRIHDLPKVAPPGYTAPLTSYFGYVDPQFDPTDPLLNDNDGADLDGDGLDYDGADASASSSIAWAWPELIRVTISLADPNDPSVEQTFQFVFDAPGNPVR